MEIDHFHLEYRKKQDDIPDKIKNRNPFFLSAFTDQDLKNRDCKGFTVNDELTDGLRRTAGNSGATLYMILLAAFNVLLSKYSSQDDLVIGSPIAGRSHGDLEHTIGMFVNTLALRNFPAGDKTFKGFLEEVRENTLNAYENQDYPFEELVEKAGVRRDLSRNPLFDVMFVFQNIPWQMNKVPGLILRPYEMEVQSTKFDLMLSAADVDDKIDFGIEYCTLLFKRETIERFIAYFKRVVSMISAAPGIRISTVEIITEEERQQVLYSFNNTTSVYPDDTTIQELFSRQAKSTPAVVSVVFEDRHLSYGELNRQSDKLAGYLGARGAKVEDVIGIMADRCGEMIAGLLATLKAGGAYLPIDHDYPEERIAYMLGDSHVCLLLTTENSVREVEKVEQIVLDVDSRAVPPGLPPHLPAKTKPAASLAYIIYTSGSTGNPKGVMVEHRCVIRLVKNTNYLDFGWSHRILQTGALEFDASTFEIWGALLNGSTLFMAGKETILAADGLKGVIGRYNITTMWMTSPLFNRMLQADIEIFSGLRYFLVGGDALSPFHINRLRSRYPGLKVINGYGPTENTTFSTTYLIDREYSESIPIGSPIANSTAFILDRYYNLQPVGVVGELWVGGDGVGRGYLNDPELTAEKFVNTAAKGREGTRSLNIPLFQHSIIPGFKRSANLYRTGDLGRFLPDGNIEFLGRVDFQVKVRGFRIELGKIEARLLDHEEIREAVVLAREDRDGDKCLAAYFVLHSSTPANRTNKTNQTSEFREYLSQALPDYMIPSYFIRLERIPLTPNGKVDRRALPEPEFGIVGEYAAPSDEIEEKLAVIWSEVLSIEKERIGVEADFFELGGHSLKATVLSARIHRELEVRVPLVEIFRVPTIRGLADYIRAAGRETFAAVRAVEEKEYYVLSSAQKRMVILQQMEETSTVYNMPQVMSLDEDIDRGHLEHTFRQLVARHESFRTSFVTIDEEPVQKIHKEVDFEIEYFDAAAKAAKGHEDIIRDFIRAFDLSKAPLLRIGLLKLAEKKHVLVTDMHHIVSDGVSMEILVREFMGLYRGESLPGLRIQYKDYAMWQGSVEWRVRVQEQAAYWLGAFPDEIPVLGLPYDFPRPLVQDFEGRSVDFSLAAGEIARLRRVCRDHGLTLFMVLLSLFTIVLSRLAGQDDIVVGTPVAGRGHADLERIIGMFVNTLALRNHPMGDKPLGEYLREVKESTLRCFENQDYQFEDLVDSLEVRRDAGRNPLFDVMFNLLTETEYGGDEPGVHEENLKEHQDSTAKFDLTLTTAERGDRLLFNIQYCTGLFKPHTIDRFITYFGRLVSSLSGDMEVKLGKIEMITEEEKNRLLCQFVSNVQQYPHENTVHQLFEKQAERFPSHIAVVYADEQITYGRLNSRINQLAGRLREKGVGPGTIVGIMAHRSLEMVVGLWGIIKSGGAYLPVDPAYPEARKRLLLQDSGVDIVLIQGGSIGTWAKGVERGGQMGVLYLDEQASYSHKTENPISVSRPDHLAYVIFTSGSTGEPKGVMVEHRGCLNILTALHRQYTLGQEDSYLFKTVYTFDVSVVEIFGWFFGGGRLNILVQGGEKDPWQILWTLAKQRVSHVNFVPSMFNLFVEVLMDHGVEKLPGLKYIFLAGEALSADLVDKFRCLHSGIFLENIYGPTEATIYSTGYSLSCWDGSGTVPIGKPLANMNAYILDSAGHLQPVGIAGELAIGGVGVARGYLNRASLNSEKFVQTAAKTREETRSSKDESLTPKSQILYRTGDLARWLWDGNIEFLGRIDHQVKIRGFRIELGEIENSLSRMDDVDDVVAIDRETTKGERYLCAYIVSEVDIQAARMREYLSRYLPEYMIPSYFVELEKIPLSPNGKVDRRALPEPEVGVGERYAAPRTAIERQLAKLWQEVLSIDKEKIGIDANFFELGGHSLKATVLTSRIQREFGITVPLVEIFKRLTIRNLAEYIGHRQRASGRMNDESLVLLREETHEALNLFLIHDGTGKVDGYVEFCRHLHSPFNCWGIRAERPAGDHSFTVTMEKLARNYIPGVRKIQAHGPYYFLGWSLGGTIAFEMARQLEGMGEKIALLALADSPGPGKHFKKKQQTPPPERGTSLDINKILSRARADYIPGSKIKTPIHYFKARQSSGSLKKYWQPYCYEEIKLFEIPGDHYSIFKTPGVMELIRQFEQALSAL